MTPVEEERWYRESRAALARISATRSDAERHAIVEEFNAEWRKPVTQAFSEIKIVDSGLVEYRGSGNFLTSANFPLLLIHETWGKVDYEDLADGFGAGMGTMGDWSAIRDSSLPAREAMLERALNHLFGGS